MQHWGIYLYNNTNKQSIIHSVLNNAFSWSLPGNGLLFNEGYIEKIIDEERRHDKFPITTPNNKSVGSMSSGEQKKAVLQYFINQQPGFIILDDWAGNLDVQNVAAMQQIITAAASHISFIQLFYRRNDLLPFVQNIITFNADHSFTEQSRTDFLQSNTGAHHFAINQLPHLYEWSIDCDPLVEMKNVNVSYEGRQVLHNINWVIRPGEFWQLKGPNGSGKTTLVSMIIGDNPKAYGQELYLFGRKKGSGESVWDIKKNIGYFYPAMMLLFGRNEPVENMIASGLTDSIGLYQEPTALQALMVSEWMELLGKDYQNKRFNQLSTGQQRIVMVIRAIIKLPPLLILDEPTAGLDDDNTDLFIQLVNQVAALKKIAIIYISHRNEPQTQPGKILELLPGTDGSNSKIVIT